MPFFYLPASIIFPSKLNSSTTSGNLSSLRPVHSLKHPVCVWTRVCVDPSACVCLTFTLLTPLLMVPGLCVRLFSLLAQELSEEQECVIHPSRGLLEKSAGPDAALRLQG